MKSEPVVSAQAIAAAVSAVIMLGLGMAVSLGWMVLNPDQMGAIEKFVTAVLALAVLIAPQFIAAFWARRQTTPIAAPKVDGQPAALIPVAALRELQVAAVPASTPAAAMPTPTVTKTYTADGVDMLGQINELRILLRKVEDDVEHMKMMVHKLLNPGDDGDF